MAKEWYFQVMGSELGPVSSAELKQRVLRGQIQADTLVRAAPDGKWQSADRVKGLIDPPAPAVVAPKTAAVTTPATVETTIGIPLAQATPATERTYHVAGDTAVEITPPDEPVSGEYDFFQFVGFEQALGVRLHQALVIHCRKQHLTLTQATRRALAQFLGRKDLLEESTGESAPEASVAVNNAPAR